MRRPFPSALVVIVAIALAECLHARRTGPAPAPSLFHYFGPGLASAIFLLETIAIVLRLNMKRLQRAAAIGSLWGAATGVFTLAYLLTSDALNSESGVPRWVVSTWDWLAIAGLAAGLTGALTIQSKLPRDVWLKAPGLLAFPGGPLIVAGVAHVAQLRDVSWALLIGWVLNVLGVLLWLAVRMAYLRKNKEPRSGPLTAGRRL